VWLSDNKLSPCVKRSRRRQQTGWTSVCLKHRAAVPRSLANMMTALESGTLREESIEPALAVTMNVLLTMAACIQAARTFPIAYKVKDRTHQEETGLKTTSCLENDDNCATLWLRLLSHEPELSPFLFVRARFLVRVSGRTSPLTRRTGCLRLLRLTEPVLQRRLRDGLGRRGRRPRRSKDRAATAARASGRGRAAGTRQRRKQGGCGSCLDDPGRDFQERRRASANRAVAQFGTLGNGRRTRTVSNNQ